MWSCPRPRYLAAALILAASLAGCSSSTDASTSVVGTYTLLTIDGQSLPVVVAQSGEDQVEVVSGTVILTADMSFTDATTFRITESGVVSTETETAVGAWSQSGGTITFRPTEGENYTMTWDGENRLTQNFEGFIIVYGR